MSYREKTTRSICHYIMKKAWSIFKNAKVICFSQALKIAWKLIRRKLYPIKSKSRGVSYGYCQKVIRCISKLYKDYYRITLERECRNPYDKNAVRIVVVIKGKSKGYLGYVSSKLSQ